ncbi:MAG: hypothetical protein QXW47_08470 [Candidatus Jordarchaeales archaeon]|nr:hypothetical protein [Candidatus Jordarchaeia archaeon]
MQEDLVIRSIEKAPVELYVPFSALEASRGRLNKNRRRQNSTLKIKNSDVRFPAFIWVT